MKTFRMKFLVVQLFVIFLVRCSEENPVMLLSPGWQKSEDMYSVNDYTWVDLISTKQLVGIWRGSKIIMMPEIAGITKPYQQLVQLSLVRVDSNTTLSRIEENSYLSNATSNGADWDAMKAYLAGKPTGTKINPTYPALSATGENAFYGSAASTPGVRYGKDYWVQHQALFPSFVKDFSVKVNTDGTKLLFQYADTIQFVIGNTKKI